MNRYIVNMESKKVEVGDTVESGCVLLSDYYLEAWAVPKSLKGEFTVESFVFGERELATDGKVVIPDGITARVIAIRAKRLQVASRAKVKRPFLCTLIGSATSAPVTTLTAGEEWPSKGDR